MKLILLKDIFLEKLQLSSKFTSSKLTSSTSLQGVYLEGKEGKIHFYSTNLNYYYHTYIKIEVDNSFKIVVEPKKIIEFLSFLTSAKIEVEIKEKSIVIVSEKIKGEFPLFSSNEFPLPPVVNKEKQKIKTSFFKNNLPYLLFSASSDETRPVLTGINFVPGDESLRIVSTDGFRLSLLTLKKEINFPSVIVPSVFLGEVIKLVGENEEISFSFLEEEKLLLFTSEDQEFYTRLIDGDYPPFEKVVPAEKKTEIVVDKEEFARRVRLISVFSRDYSNIIILQITKEGLKISPKAGEGGENEAFQEADVKGEDQKIAFNHKFLIDFLNNVTGKKIIIELLRSDAPAVFKIEGVSNFLHIIMPVRIQE
jgi:DNA polymerase-3 subunit beta